MDMILPASAALRPLLPVASDPILQGLETRFVVHLPGFADPVAEIVVGQAKTAGLGDLPQDRVGAQAAAADLRIVEEVDGG